MPEKFPEASMPEAFQGLRFLIVGSGFAGSVVAERIANDLQENVLVFEERPHIGGCSFSEPDSSTGIELHRYGSHIFHTNDESVWNYITQFGDFNRYQHHVFSSVRGRLLPLPVNLQTINLFFGTSLSPEEAREFLREKINGACITQIMTFEDQAVSQIGPELYQALIAGYTQKQWGVDPRLLAPEIIARLPVRFNLNSDYFNAKYQGIPVDGYGQLFRRILAHPRITVATSVAYAEIRTQIPHDCIVVYTGRPETLFDNEFGVLAWRSLHFEWSSFNVCDWQGNSVINYPDPEVPYTRTHEFKHYRPEAQENFDRSQTVVCHEYPQAFQPGREPFYPAADPVSLKRYELYRNKAQQCGNIHLAGRLGGYRYIDMDQAICEALQLYRKIKSRHRGDAV